MRAGDRAIRWTTTLSVVVLAGIAAVLSYKHMYVLVRRYGETSWTAALLPVSVDGMIAASSMTLLADSRHGRRSGLLPWTLVIVGSMASLAANVAVAEPSAVGRLIAAWPSAALIGSYELLMRQVRHAAARQASDSSYAPHTNPASDDIDEGAPLAAPVSSWGASNDFRTDNAERLARDAGDLATWNLEPRERSRIRPRPPVSELRRNAWLWALANRTPTGDLPSGKTIAEHFGRRERWGRLVKQAGLAGRLSHPVGARTHVSALPQAIPPVGADVGQ